MIFFMIAGQITRSLALILGIIAYLSRAWSCGIALGTFSPNDNVPYAKFDYHGFGTMIGWVSAVLFAAPVYALARNIIEPTDRSRKSPNIRLLFGSLSVAIIIAMPTFIQLAYLAQLPLQVVTPVLVSSVFWAVTVFGFWWIYISKDADADADKRQNLKAKALLLSFAILVPKTLIIGWWIFAAW